MTDLDQKLEDILNNADWYQDGLNPSGKEDRDAAIEQIKQAFFDDGYIKPEPGAQRQQD